MRNPVTVNISFQGDLLREIDAEAKRESRTRSEFIREAARTYMTRQRKWDAVFALGDKVAEGAGLSEADVAEAVRGVRRRRRPAA